MSLEQKIAGKAQTLVKAQRTGTDGEPEYRSLVEGFPVMLRTAGLLQSIVFLKAKREHPHGTLFGHLTEQLTGIGLLNVAGPDKDLPGAIAKLNAAQYRLFTQMADRAAYWHKRMAQAYLRTKKELQEELQKKAAK